MKWPAKRRPSKREAGKALREMARLGILVVVEDTGDPLTTTYRMPDREGVGRALAELEAEGKL